MRRIAILALAMAGCLALVLLGGCSGGEGIIVPNNLGSVSGVILAGLEDQIGFGNVEILLNTQTNPAVTVARGFSTANGNFTVENVPPGTYDVVLEVDPNTGFRVDPDGDPIVVTVLPNDDTGLGDITVPEENELPPRPPEEG